MSINFGFLLFTDIQQLDFTAPYEVLATVSGVNSSVDLNIELVAETMLPVRSVTGL